MKQGSNRSLKVNQSQILDMVFDCYNNKHRQTKACERGKITILRIRIIYCQIGFTQEFAVV